MARTRPAARHLIPYSSYGLSLRRRRLASSAPADNNTTGTENTVRRSQRISSQRGSESTALPLPSGHVRRSIATLPQTSSLPSAVPSNESSESIQTVDCSDRSTIEQWFESITTSVSKEQQRLGNMVSKEQQKLGNMVAKFSKLQRDIGNVLNDIKCPCCLTYKPLQASKFKHIRIHK